MHQWLNGSYPEQLLKRMTRTDRSITFTKDLQRWNQDGEEYEERAEAAKLYRLQASNDVSTQVSQLENQVANGCDLLVMASIDGSSLEPLKQAKEAEIPVISYDRLYELRCS